MKDRLYERLLLDCGREDLASAVGTVEDRYGAKFEFSSKMVSAVVVQGREKPSPTDGTISVTRGFTLDPERPPTPHWTEDDSIRVFPSPDQRPPRQMCVFTTTPEDFTRKTELMLAKLSRDVPGVGSYLRMSMQLSHGKIPAFLDHKTEERP